MNEVGTKIVSDILGDLVYEEGEVEGYKTLGLCITPNSYARVWIHDDGSVCVRPGLYDVDEDVALADLVLRRLLSHEIEVHPIKDCKYNLRRRINDKA